jgi:competence protein ComEC
VFLGDLGERAQQILAARERFSPVDVVKVSHHGSADQYHPLYEALGASIALIGVGAENTYGQRPPWSVATVTERRHSREVMAAVS